MTKRTRTLAAIAIGTAVSLSVLIAVPAVSDPADTFGRIPDEAWQQDGSIDQSLVPDYVEALDRDGNIVGYVRAAHILPLDGTEPPDEPIPVVNEEKQLVGHHHPGRGFVPLGTDASQVPTIPTTVVELPSDQPEPESG